MGASVSAPAVPAGVAVDRSYNAYVAGAYGVPQGIQGIWIERIDLSGAANATFTLQGQHSNVGPAEDVPAGISLDPTAGDVFITGITTSTDFPTTPGAPQPRYGGGASDAFVSKISFGGVVQPLDEPRAAQAGVRLVLVQSTICRTLRCRRQSDDAMVERSSAIRSGSTSISSRPSLSAK